MDACACGHHRRRLQHDVVGRSFAEAQDLFAAAGIPVGVHSAPAAKYPQNKIEHMVVLFVENRAADHLFGCMLGDHPQFDGIPTRKGYGDGTDGQHAQQEREQLCDARVNNPEWLIGRHAHKLFSEWGGVCRARVTSYDPERKLWSVQYEADGVTEEFDYNDMVKYVVDKVADWSLSMIVPYL